MPADISFLRKPPPVYLIGASLVIQDARTIIPSGGLLVRDRIVEEVCTFKALRTEHSSSFYRFLPDSIILPGLVNAHAHIELSSLGPLNGSQNGFVPWLIDLVRRRALISPGARSAGFRMGLNSILASGTTSIGDIASFGFPAESLDIPARRSYLARSGLRTLTLIEALGLDPSQARDRAAALDNRIQENARPVSPFRRLRFGVSIHAPYSVSDDLASSVARLARRRSLPIAAHLLETPFERNVPRRRPAFREYCAAFGWDPAWLDDRPSSPIEWLDRHHLLTPNTLAIHGIHLNQREMTALARRRISLVLCPRSNLYLHDRLPPVRELVGRGVPLAIGTDSLASNFSLSLWDEIRALHERFPEIPPSRLFEIATAGGAAALGLAGRVGVLHAGYCADFTVLRPPFRVDTERRLFYNLIRSAQDAHVQGVVTDGRLRFQRTIQP
ncbi:MAG: amidohydrolase family protein [Nitrospirota bacterium]